MPKVKTPTVFFNASVVLAGLKSPSGGSGKLLLWIKRNKIKGVISEIILDEVLRNSGKINKNQKQLNKIVQGIFSIQAEPKKETVALFEEIVVYPGDAHVLASGLECGADYLVTLDQKHILVLKGHIKEFKIVTPGQLIMNK